MLDYMEKGVKVKFKKLSSNYANKISTLYKDEYKPLYLLGTVYQSPKITAYLQFICEKKLEDFFGIVEDRALMAVLQYKEVDRFLHINHIVVSSSYQGHGFGKILLAGAIKQAELNNFNVSLDVNACNTKAFNWYLSTGFEIDSESRLSVFKLASQNPSAVNFYDERKLIDFGISNAHIENFDDLEFFYIEPNTFILKSHITVDEDLLAKLHEAINGFLVVDSSLLSKGAISTSIYDKVVIRMIKNIV